MRLQTLAKIPQRDDRHEHRSDQARQSHQSVCERALPRRRRHLHVPTGIHANHTQQDRRALGQEQKDGEGRAEAILSSDGEACEEELEGRGGDDDEESEARGLCEFHGGSGLDPETEDEEEVEVEEGDVYL